MRLIDTDALDKAIDGTTMSQEQRNLFHALVAHCPIREDDEDVVNKMQNEIDYWRRHCDLLENTIIKLAIRYMERESV